MRSLARVVVVLVSLAGAGCAGSAGSGSTGSPSSTHVAAGAMRVLAASSVPGVPSVTTVLTEDDLAKDASIPDLASQIANWGYVDGRQRTFQGQSRHLSLVVSRALVFQHPTGAASFVAFVRKNSGAYFGDATQVQALRADGRSGWMFTPAPCACHMANPAMIGVLEMGPQVIWLQINGPDASPALLLRLLDPNRSVPTT